MKKALGGLLAGAMLLGGLTLPANAAEATGSLPKGQDAETVLSTLTVEPQGTESSDRKDHDWNHVEGKPSAYNTRDAVLDRDLTEVTYKESGRVNTGKLKDPYTNATIDFKAGTGGGADGGIQIDHVVAYAEAYNSGLSKLTAKQRDAYYNDTDVLLAVRDSANTEKSDSDAAQWMSFSADFACPYVALQIGVKAKYGLSVDQAEKDAMTKTLDKCDG